MPGELLNGLLGRILCLVGYLQFLNAQPSLLNSPRIHNSMPIWHIEWQPVYIALLQAPQGHRTSFGVAPMTFVLPGCWGGFNVRQVQVISQT